MKLKERFKALGKVIAAAEEQFGQGAIVHRVKVIKEESATAFKTGSLGLDWALGTGGWPKGRMVEIYGPASSGKTTLALHAIQKCQANEGIAAYIDAEHAFNPKYATELGIEVEDLLISKPSTGEEALKITELLVQSDQVDLIVIDSVAALLPKAELDGDLGDMQIGSQARMMSQALRKLVSVIARSKTTILFINQIRHTRDSFGYQEITPGGSALKFFASIRVDLRVIKGFRDGKQKSGHRIRAKVTKNKITLPFREAEFDIRYGSGINYEAELLDWGESFSLVNKNGTWYEIEGQSLGQGYIQSCEYLRNNPAQAKELEDKLQAQLLTDTSIGSVVNSASNSSTKAKLKSPKKNRRKKENVVAS